MKQSWLFENNSNKITKIKREKTQIKKIRNEMEPSQQMPVKFRNPLGVTGKHIPANEKSKRKGWVSGHI